MSPQCKILDKLSKLKAARDGEAKIGNSAAAEAFAEAISRLLLQHELSEVDIPESGVKDEPVVEEMVDLESHGIKRTRVRIGWQEVLARVVARAHLCKFLVTPGSNRITFVGTHAHATFAAYAYGVLVSSADRMSVEARNAYWRAHSEEPDFNSGNFRAAWLSGFIQRIAERFAEARRAEVAACASTSTALMRLDQAIVRADGYIKDRYKKKSAPAQMATGCAQGQVEGRRAADRVKLGQRGVEQGAAQRRLR